MKVPVPTVIISTSKESIEKFFTEGVTYKTLVAELAKDPNVILFNNYSKAQLIEFKHSIRGENGTRFRLSFVDPTGEFEAKFITTNMAEYAFAGLKQEAANPLFQTLKKDQEERVIAEKALVDSYSKLFTEDISKRVYVLYGIGSDLDNWSGPHTTTLIGADLGTQGSRKITIDLSPDIGLSYGSRRGMFNEYINLNAGFAVELEAKSFPFDFNKLSIYREDYLNEVKRSPIVNNSKELTKDNFLGNPFRDFEEFDVHLLLTDLIKSYIKKATNGNSNVIVLLPDINVTAFNAIEEYVKAETPKVRTQQPGTTLILELDFVARTQAVLKLLGLEWVGEPNQETINNSFSNYYLNSIQQQDYAESYLERSSKWNNDRAFYAVKTVRSNNGLPYLQEGLNEITKTIKEITVGSSGSQIMTIYESSIALSKVWADPTYQPLQLFKDFDENKPTIIYGDIHLINDYLYANRYQTDTFQYLYPQDKVILLNNSYYSKVKSIINPKKIRVTPYGSISNIPDELAFSDSEAIKLQKAIIEEESLPIFRYNTSNPNVIDLAGKFNASYLDSLSYAVGKETNRKASLGLAGVIPTKYSNFNFSDVEAIITFIRLREKQIGFGGDNKSAIIREVANKLKNDSNLSPLLPGSTPQEKAEFCFSFYLKLLSEDRPLIKIDQLMPGDPINVLYDFVERAFQTAINVQIKTLPFFHISRVNNIGKGCILYAQLPQITRMVKPKTNLVDTFLSGFYGIFGITNTITPTEVYSEFTLAKPGLDVSPRKEDNDDSMEIKE